MTVLGRREGAEGWYGAIELKWPGTSNDVAKLRLEMVQDAIRVAFTDTGNMNARFFMLGGSEAAIHRVFEKPHPGAADAEAQRIAFGSLFSRDLNAPKGSLTNAELRQQFPAALDRIDPAVPDGWTRRFATQLIAVSEARVGSSLKGQVFIWQCRK